jgi:hypothetical protein
MKIGERVSAYFAGRLAQRTLLVGIPPVAFVSYFGALILAILLSPVPHDWYSATISKLAFHPKNHAKHDNGWMASDGIALTGVLIAPFAGYIGRRFHSAAREAARFGAGCFRAGALGCLLAGMVAYRADSAFPGLHTLLARFCALALSLAMFSFWFCALKARFPRPAEVHDHARLLFACWTLLIAVGPAAALLSAIDSGRHQALAGLYEWLASALAYLFLLAAAALLPDTPSQG